MERDGRRKESECKAREGQGQAMQEGSWGTRIGKAEEGQGKGWAKEGKAMQHNGEAR